MNKCEICGKEVEELNELYLDGTDDLYVLEVCNSCNNKYSDYYTSEEIDNIIKNIK